MSSNTQVARPGDIYSSAPVVARLDDLDANHKMHFLDRSHVVLTLSTSDRWCYRTRLLVDDHPIPTIVGNKDLRIVGRCW